MENHNQTPNSFLIRSKGKKNATINKQHFFDSYLLQTTKPVPRPIYNGFTNDLLIAFSNAIVKDNLELKMKPIGFLRIKARDGKQLRIDKLTGEFTTLILKVDWKATWEYWYKKYEGLSRNQIVALKGKKVIYHENNHSDGEIYEHHWDKLTSALKNKSYYKFSASRQFSRLLASTVKDPNRKTFYYG